MNRTRPLLLVLAALLIPGCRRARPEEKAEAAVRHFHDRYDARAYGELYELADARFRAATSAAEFGRLLERVQAVMGRADSSELVQHVAADTAVAVAYRTHFANGDAVEVFTWSIAGGDLRLNGYRVDSPMLLRSVAGWPIVTVRPDRADTAQFMGNAPLQSASGWSAWTVSYETNIPAADSAALAAQADSAFERARAELAQRTDTSAVMIAHVRGEQPGPGIRFLYRRTSSGSWERVN